MDRQSAKNKRYERLYNQIKELTTAVQNPISRMATISAILHHKQPLYFWTGFYLLDQDGDLMVGPYQGPVACLKLSRDSGVCREGIKRAAPVVVDDVEMFPGHIACDSRSKSEIVIPVKNHSGNIVGVLDVDSDKLNSFDQTDVTWLEKITALVFEQ
jgi:GAF domain-containing protein